jgi:hypothetical protein
MKPGRLVNSNALFVPILSQLIPIHTTIYVPLKSFVVLHHHIAATSQVVSSTQEFPITIFNAYVSLHLCYAIHQSHPWLHNSHHNVWKVRILDPIVTRFPSTSWYIFLTISSQTFWIYALLIWRQTHFVNYIRLVSRLHVKSLRGAPLKRLLEFSWLLLISSGGLL